MIITLHESTDTTDSVATIPCYPHQGLTIITLHDFCPAVERLCWGTFREPSAAYAIFAIFDIKSNAAAIIANTAATAAILALLQYIYGSPLKPFPNDNVVARTAVSAKLEGRFCYQNRLY